MKRNLFGRVLAGGLGLFLGGLLYLGPGLAGGGLPLARWAALLGDQAGIRRWLAGFGPLAPLVSIGLNVLQVVLAPIPGQFLGLANGYLFGVFWGTLYSLIGLTLGSLAAMGIGRWLGRRVVVRLVSPDQLERWDRLLSRRGSLLFFFLVFLLPLLPDDVTCFVIGLSPLPIPYLLLLATLGRLPGLVFSSWLGAQAGHLSWPWLVSLVLLVVAGALLATRYQDRLVGWMERQEGNGAGEG